MSDKNISLEMRYLLLLPFQATAGNHQHISLESPKDAPYFYELDIDVRSLSRFKKQYEDTEIEIISQLFDENVYVFECRYTLKDKDEDHARTKHAHIKAYLKQFLNGKYGTKKNKMTEEYTIITSRSENFRPDEFVDRNAPMLAGFIMNASSKNPDRKKIDDILVSRIRYSEQDLVVVDWNGAVVISKDGDFQSDIDMLKIGNYQLIRYRMLDELLEERLNYLYNIILKHNRRFSLRTNSLLQEIVKQRLSILLTMEKLDTSLMLIGDWYSAHLYKIIFEEFYINRWKTIVETKLDNLKSLHETIRENFSLSWRRIIDQITFVGWFLMMVGYFVLFYIDLRKR